MKHANFIKPAILAVVLICCLSVSPSAAAIAPLIDSNQVLSPDGKLRIDAFLSNGGNEPMFHTRATIFFDDQVLRSDDLGDCRPKGTVSFKASFDASHATPGDFVIMVRFEFDDQNARKHQSFQPAMIRIPAGDTVEKKSMLKASAREPSFNPKAFWKKEDSIRLTLKNDHAVPITPDIVFYLTQDYFSPHGNLRPTLPPGKVTTIDVPVVCTGDLPQSGKFIATIQYELDGRHHATAIRGEVMVVSKPVIFKGYVITSLLILTMAGVFLIRNPKNKSEMGRG